MTLEATLRTPESHPTDSWELPLELGKFGRSGQMGTRTSPHAQPMVLNGIFRPSAVKASSVFGTRAAPKRAKSAVWVRV